MLCSMKLFFSLIFLAALFTQSPAQSVGGFLGGGIINANSLNIGSVSGSFFLETPLLFNTKASARLSFLYSVDIDHVLPSTTTNYSPFIRGITLKAIASQPMSKTIYIEEGVGLIVLNDRVFSDVNEIDYGMVISVAAGFDLRENNPSGFKVGAGTDYGFTFTNTYAKYFSLYLQGQYYF